MNKHNFIIVIILFFSLSNLCWAQTQSPYWIGDGGRGIRVTVSEPTGTGISAQEQALIPLIQSTIIGSFQRFSAMTVFDRQNLENVLREQRLSMTGDFSDINYIRIGQLTNARFVVFGSITKISNNYLLELAVTDVETGERKASYPPRQISLMALENLSAIREASADLLGQLGINLTASGLQELRRINDTARIQAENALARGIAAQRQGTVVEALAYYFQAAAFDSSLGESMKRITVVSANISAGNLGEAVRNRIQEHDDWRAVIQAADSFYSNHLPYELIYGSDISQGSIDFERRTTELSTGISLMPTDAWKTINDLRKGLHNARRNDQWNFSFDRIGPRQITVVAQILNENNIVLSRASHTFDNLSETTLMNTTLSFQNVKAAEITDRLRVEVVSINEIPAQRAGETGFIQITALSEYDKWIAQLKAKEEAARKWQEKFSRSSVLPPVFFEIGYIFQPDYPLGFRVGTFGFYLTMNFHTPPDWQGYEHPWTYVTAGADYIDHGNRTEESFEWLLGFSFNVFDNLLSIPIGIGARHTKEYGLYTTTHKYISNNTEWYPLYIDMKPYLLLEAGISLNLIKWASLIGTLRVIGFQEASFTIGTCLTVPVKR